LNTRTAFFSFLKKPEGRSQVENAAEIKYDIRMSTSLQSTDHLLQSVLSIMNPHHCEHLKSRTKIYEVKLKC